MVIALASCLMLLLGVEVAIAVPRYDAALAARAEVLCGSLLAAGLMLVGVGIHSSFG